MKDMSDFFLLLFVLSLFALMSGLISPKLVLWIWGESNKTRKEVLRYFGTTAVAFFIIYGISTAVFRPKPMKEPKKSVPPVEKQDENVKYTETELRIWDFMREWYEIYKPSWWYSITDIDVRGHHMNIETWMYLGELLSGGLDRGPVESAKSICRVMLFNEPFDMGIRSIDVRDKSDRIIVSCKREDKMHPIEMRQGRGGM